nr:hypothetical protein Iba_chr09fCG1790 [Ipomoea batatas]
MACKPERSRHHMQQMAHHPQLCQHYHHKSGRPDHPWSLKYEPWFLLQNPSSLCSDANNITAIRFNSLTQMRNRPTCPTQYNSYSSRAKVTALNRCRPKSLPREKIDRDAEQMATPARSHQ